MSSSQLPGDLEYLQPVLDVIGAVPSEELDEDINVSRVLDSIKQRITGLSFEDAEERIEADQHLLRNWLSGPGMESSPAHFILALLNPFIVAELDDESQDPSDIFEPSLEAELQLPNSLKCATLDGMVEAVSGTLLLTVSPLDYLERKVFQMQIDAWKPLPGMKGSITPVDFGEVHGIKHCILQSEPMYGKSVQYLLDVPGGYVHVDICNEEEPFDETVYETYFNTIRVRKLTSD